MEKLQTLVSTLEAQHASKADYVLPAEVIKMEGGLIQSGHADLPRVYTPNEIFHEGVSERLAIPMQYYRRMRAERPELLDLSVNHWLEHLGGKKLMIRTFENYLGDNVARALMSNSYLALDNYDVLFAALDAIKKSGIRVDITHADVTERRMYVNCVCREVEIDAKETLKGYLQTRDGVGNGIISGFTITNSEVGQGQFQIRPRAVVLKCDNGLIVPDDSFSRIHLGKKLEEGMVKWSQQTKNKNYELIMSQVGDAVKTFLSPEYLGTVIEKLAVAHQIKLDNPIDTVQNVCKELRYTDDQRHKILGHFLEGGDHAASGVTHAITRHAQDEDPDKRQDMETKAFEILPKIKGFDKKFSGN
jgi:hypothetical protein